MYNSAPLLLDFDTAVFKDYLQSSAFERLLSSAHFIFARSAFRVALELPKQANAESLSLKENKLFALREVIENIYHGKLDSRAHFCFNVVIQFFRYLEKRRIPIPKYYIDDLIADLREVGVKNDRIQKLYPFLNTLHFMESEASRPSAAARVSQQDIPARDTNTFDREKKKELIILLANGEVATVIDFLKEVLMRPETSKEMKLSIMNLTSRYSRLKQTEALDLQDFESVNLEFNKINKAILRFLDV